VKVANEVLAFYTKKVLIFAISMFFAAGLIFFVISLTPGNIADIHGLSPTTAASLHLDKNIFSRFLLWTYNAFTLNFGPSLANGTQVTELIFDYAPTTIQLAIGSLVFSLLLSVPLAIVFALYPHNKWARLSSTLVYALSSLPVFVVAFIILALIFNLLHIYPLDPPTENAPFWHILFYQFLPMIVLGVGNGTLGEFVRLLQLEIENTNQALYIKSARARGAFLFPHFFRPVLLSFITILVSRFAILLGGVIVVERIFNRRGLGWLTWESTLNRDFFVLMGVAFLTVLVIRIFILAQEIIIYQLDPRRR